MKTLASLVLCCLLSAAPVVAQDEGGTIDLENLVRERVDEIVDRLATGQRSVLAYDSLIARHAETHGVNAGWLRAIIMIEAQRSEDDDSGRRYPTGINVKWAGLDNSTLDTFSDISENIRLAALLLRRIADSVRDPDQNLNFVASLFDDIGTDTVTPYGLAVERAYYVRIWDSNFRK